MHIANLYAINLLVALINIELALYFFIHLKDRILCYFYRVALELITLTISKKNRTKSYFHHLMKKSTSDVDVVDDDDDDNMSIEDDQEWE